MARAPSTAPRREAALAARPAMSPTGPATDQLRVATWNLNSLRARLPADRTVLGPDPSQRPLLAGDEGRQPCRRTPPPPSPRHGYEGPPTSAPGPTTGSRSWPAIRLKTSRILVRFDDEHLDREPEFVSCLVRVPEPLRVVSVYAPHGRTVDHCHYQYKLSFFDALIRAGRTVGPRDGTRGGRRGPQRRGDRQRRVPSRRLRRLHPRHPAASGTRSAASSTSGLVDVDVARWGPGPGGSRGGTTASATPATSACASTSSPPTTTCRPGSTRPGSITPSAAPSARRTTPRCVADFTQDPSVSRDKPRTRRVQKESTTS